MTFSSNSLSWDHLLDTTRSKELLPSIAEEDDLPEECRENSGSDGKENGQTDHRSEFDRDYDRTLFSPPVRRLQDKAQVFPLDPNDSVRTRGTHSMEVANLAKSVVNRLWSFFKEEGLEDKQIGHIRSIAETCGILHDLGNPPYGHAGETAMQNWFEKTFTEYRVKQGNQDNRCPYTVLASHEQNNGIPTLGEHLEGYEGDNLAAGFLNFDGNAQTIRLVTKLQMLADFSGLNLTAGTLAAALKYTTRADQTNQDFHAHEKPGFFFSEREIVKKVRDVTNLGECRHPITYIVEACDDMVYSVVDLEDGIKKQVVTWDDLAGAFDKGSTGARLINMAEKNVRCRLKEADHHGNQLSRQGIDEARAQLFRTYAIGEHVQEAVSTFQEHYDEIMRGTYGKEKSEEGELLEDGNTSGLLDVCKTLGQDEVYTASEIITREAKGRRIIADLMDFFWEGARCTFWDVNSEGSGKVKVEGEFAEKAYNLMSENYKIVFERDMSQKRVDETEIPREYRQLQLVADYISGMTDGFAQSLHKDLFNG